MGQHCATTLTYFYGLLLHYIVDRSLQQPCTTLTHGWWSPLVNDITLHVKIMVILDTDLNLPSPQLKVLKQVSPTDPLTATGLSMEYPDGSSPSCTVAVVTCDQFILPDQYVPVSAVYKISLTGASSEPIRVKMQHCVDVKDEKVSKRMSFALASHSSTEFQLIPGGNFPVGERYGYIERYRFCNLLMVDEMMNSMYYRINSGFS